MAKINPIETIEQANLDYGLDELDTHLEREHLVIHDIDEVQELPEAGKSATLKLTNILVGYYHSPDGVFPLDEFLYWITDTSIIIFNRLACRLIEVGIGSFTLDEIDWIANNLPMYNDGQDISSGKHYLDFRELRNEGWMVFRRSGSNIQLIGYIRHHLDHFYKCNNPKVPYHFENRDDLIIIVDEEFKIIDNFIKNQIPKVPVTRLTTEKKSYEMLIGESISIEMQIYPIEATDKSIKVETDNDFIVKYEIKDNIINIKALDEGIVNIIVTSNDNPEEIVNIELYIYEYKKLLNDNYPIYRGENLIYGFDIDYIEISGQIISSEFFKSSFKNRVLDVKLFDETHTEIMEGTRFVGTGMIVELHANNKHLDSLWVVYKGDVSGDGQIGGYDITQIENHINGIRELEGAHFIAADVDFNGVVDEQDLNKLNKMIQDSGLNAAVIEVNDYFVVERLLGKYIVNIEPGTTIKQFKEHVINDLNLINIYNKNGNYINMDTQKVATGMTVRFESKGHIYDEVFIVVLGDVTGDGVINLLDQTVIMNAARKNTKLEFPYTIAADLNFDGRVDGIDETHIKDFASGSVKSFIRLAFDESISTNIKEDKFKYLTYYEPENLPTIQEMFDHLYNVKEVIYVYDCTNNIVDDYSQKIHTGMSFKLKDQYNDLTFDEIYFIVKGSLDKNPTVDVSDMQLIRKYLANNVTLTDYQLLAADVDDSGYVNDTDIYHINRYITGKIHSFVNLDKISLYDTLVTLVRSSAFKLKASAVDKINYTVTLTDSKTKPITMDMIWFGLSDYSKDIVIYDTDYNVLYRDNYEYNDKFSNMSSDKAYEMLMSQELIDKWILQFRVSEESWVLQV